MSVFTLNEIPTATLTETPPQPFQRFSHIRADVLIVETTDETVTLTTRVTDRWELPRSVFDRRDVPARPDMALSLDVQMWSDDEANWMYVSGVQGGHRFGGKPTTTTPILSPELAAVLDRHGIAHTTDGVADAIEAKGYRGGTCFTEADYAYLHMYRRVDPRGPLRFAYGKTFLSALAVAFAAIVGEEER